MLERKRKFTLAMMALAMSFTLTLLGYLDGDNWVMVTTFIVGLYGAANVGEWMAKKKTNG